MALVSDIETTRLSGLNHIDALLDNGPGWNWLTPARSVLNYTFSVSSGNEVGNTGISGAVTAFNAAQQSASLSLLAYVTKLTGIQFAATADGTAADLHFANVNIGPDTSIAGLCSYGSSYSFTAANLVTRYAAQAYVYMDNVEWAQDNLAPVAGSAGYETLLHEIGHALGLKHPFADGVRLPPTEDNTANTVMSYTSAGEHHSIFSPYDVAALMWLYGGDGLSGTLGAQGSHLYFTGNASNNTLTGGTGVDVAAFSGKRANYTVQKTASGFTVKDTTGADGTDTLSSIERLQFTDQKLALDLGATALGGLALQLIGLLAPSTVNTPSVVGSVLQVFDQDSNLQQVCQLALDIGLVTALAGANTNTALAAMAYRNIVGTEPNAAALDMLLGYMDGRSASLSQAGFMAAAASLELNQTHIGLVGLQQTGVVYG
jgi:hypothetical protein